MSLILWDAHLGEMLARQVIFIRSLTQSGSMNFSLLVWFTSRKLRLVNYERPNGFNIVIMIIISFLWNLQKSIFFNYLMDFINWINLSRKRIYRATFKLKVLTLKLWRSKTKKTISQKKITRLLACSLLMLRTLKLESLSRNSFDFWSHFNALPNHAI